MAKIIGLNEPEAKPGERWLMFFCPGCECGHRFKIAGNSPPIWEFNGNVEKPTLTPSYLCWGENFRCHSFIVDGEIRFLEDSTHELKGKVVELPDMDW